MILQYSPWAVPLIVSAGIALMLAAAGWPHRDRLIARIFIALSAAIVLASLCLALQASAADIATASRAGFASLVILAVVPVPVLLLTLCAVGREYLVTGKTLILLLAVPLLQIALLITDPVHHLYITGIVPVLLGNAVSWQYLFGPLYGLFPAYACILLVAAAARVAYSIAQARDRLKTPLGPFFIACCIPLAMGIASIGGAGGRAEFPYLVPLGYTAACIIVASPVLRENKIPLMPVSYPIIFASMKDGVIVIDANREIAEMNPAAESMLETGTGGLLGRPVNEAIPFIRPLLDHDDGSGKAATAEVTTTAGADVRYFEGCISPIVLRQGGRGGSLIILRDITGPKKTEIAIRESERKYRELADLLPEIVFECDLAANLTYVNENGLKVFGYTREDLRHGLNILAHLAEFDRNRAEADIQNVIISGKSRGNEYTAMRKDGSTFPVFVATTRVIRNGTCTGLRGILIDNTERKRSEQAIQMAMKKLKILNSITRHDIINKLTALGAFLTLTKEISEDPGVMDYLGECEEIVRTINEHVEFMKDYQEIGIRAPLWQDVDAVVRRVAASCTMTGISVEQDRTGAEIYADPLLEKVIYNLLDNAVRHGEHVTLITFTSTQVAGGLAIIYEDDGAGVPAYDKTRLFEKGYGKNTGLGLFLSREILSITGISIRENGIPGKGARFEIIVPEGGYRIRKVNHN